MKVLISGGGTGGHVFPAIAIADALKKKDGNTDILFVGANGKIEMDKVPQAGYKIIGLDIKGFKRSFSLDTIVTTWKAAKALFKAINIVKTFKPDVAIGVGGYASGPTLKVASLLGVPTMIQEQNSYAGVTNKLLARKASKIFVAYSGMEKFFEASKIVHTGNPIRSTIQMEGKSKKEAMQKLGLNPDHKMILVMGGSLGARTINEALVEGEALLAQSTHVHIYWQVGKLYLSEFKNKNIATLPNVTMVDFIEDMPTVYTAADIIVGRAGALTISELAIVGKAAILVPSPNVAEDHQTHNAMSLVNAGAAILVKDIEAGKTLVPVMINLVNDHEQSAKLAANMKGLAKPNAADQIATYIFETIGKV